MGLSEWVVQRTPSRRILRPVLTSDGFIDVRPLRVVVVAGLVLGERCSSSGWIDELSPDLDARTDRRCRAFVSVQRKICKGNGDSRDVVADRNRNVVLDIVADREIRHHGDTEATQGLSRTNTRKLEELRRADSTSAVTIKGGEFKCVANSGA